MISQEIVIREDSLAEQALSHQFDFNLWLQQHIHSTPWWLASLMFHFLLILMLASIPIAEPPQIPDIPIVTPITPDENNVIERIPEINPITPLTPEERKTVETQQPPTENPFDTPTDNPNDYFTNSPLIGKGTEDTIGIGGKLGGGRPGGNLGTTNKIEETSVLAALQWLARHQNPDGSWGAKSFQHQCRITHCSGTGDEQFDIGLTGLALLAFTGAGYTTYSSRDIYDGIRFSDVVRKAVQFLINQQISDGSFTAVKDGKFMYNQAICTYALADLYGLSMDRPAGLNFKEPVERAVKFLLESQNPNKAWRYQPRDGQNDTSVTGWVTMALKTAEHCGITVPPEAFAGIKSFYDDVTDPTYGQVGYTERGSKALMSNEDPRTTLIQPSTTAIGVMTRIFIDKKTSDPLVKLAVAEVLKSLPAWDTSKSGIIDYYYWFYATYCLNQYDGPNGAGWNAWNEKMKDVLLKNQHTKQDGCADGSWEPIDRWSSEGSRVYATAINTLTLEVYYRLEIIRLNKK